MPIKKKQLLAKVEVGLAKKLKVKLAKDDCTYRVWLEGQIRQYTCKGQNRPPAATVG